MAQRILMLGLEGTESGLLSIKILRLIRQLRTTTLLKRTRAMT